LERSSIWKRVSAKSRPSRAHISLPEADVRSNVSRIALGTIIGEQPGREMLAADRRRSSTYRLSCVRELISITRVRTRSTPDVGRLRVVVRQLVPVLRHRQHPHGAERGNHRDIHDNPHGPIPPVHTVGIAPPCQEFREGAEILRVWLSGNESARSFCPTRLSSLPKKKSRRVLGVRSALLGQRFARLELKGQIGVVIVGWDWGTGEWAKSSTLLSCGAAFGTVL